MESPQRFSPIPFQTISFLCFGDWKRSASRLKPPTTCKDSEISRVESDPSHS